MLLANGYFILKANLKTPWEFVKDCGQMSNATHLYQNSPANIGGGIDLPINTKAFEKFSQIWHDFFTDRSVIDPGNVHLVLHFTK
jgi:hypothetical protein